MHEEQLKGLVGILSGNTCLLLARVTGVVGVVVSTTVTRVQSPGSAYRQFRFMPKMEVLTNEKSQKVTAASV